MKAQAVVRKKIYKKLLGNVLKSTAIRDLTVYNERVDRLMKMYAVLKRHEQNGYVTEGAEANSHLLREPEWKFRSVFDYKVKDRRSKIGKYIEMVMYSDCVDDEEKTKMLSKITQYAKKFGLYGAHFDEKKPMKMEIKYDKCGSVLMSNEVTAIFKANYVAFGYKPFERKEAIKYFIACEGVKYDLMA